MLGAVVQVLRLGHAGSCSRRAGGAFPDYVSRRCLGPAAGAASGEAEASYCWGLAAPRRGELGPGPGPFPALASSLGPRRGSRWVGRAGEAGGPGCREAVPGEGGRAAR